MTVQETETASPEATRALAARFAADLTPGTILLLIGDYGSGKTTFVQGLAEGMGVKDLRAVCSPTFVMMNVYEGRMPLCHMDATRFADPREVFGLGWEEWARGVTAIEWGDRVAERLPARCRRVEFETAGPESRRIRIESPGAADA